MFKKNNTYKYHQRPPQFLQVDLIFHPSPPSSSYKVQTPVHFLLWFVCPCRMIPGTSSTSP